MPELNCDIPVFECLVRNEFLYNFKKGHGEFSKAISFAVASVPGRAVGFHCLLDNGAVYGRLPIHALTWVPPKTKPIENVSELQLWDAPSEHISCIVYDFLKEGRCHVLLPSGEQQGQYMFTLDWWGSSYAENAGALGWKSAHMIRLDNGYFALQPNNRILWECPAFVKKLEKPDYALTERVWKCEGGGTTGDEYFYDFLGGLPGPLVELPGLPTTPLQDMFTYGKTKNCIYCEKYPCVCAENEEVWL